MRLPDDDGATTALLAGRGADMARFSQTAAKHLGLVKTSDHHGHAHAKPGGKDANSCA
jgi:hypothetical protein